MCNLKSQPICVTSYSCIMPMHSVIITCMVSVLVYCVNANKTQKNCILELFIMYVPCLC